MRNVIIAVAVVAAALVAMAFAQLRFGRAQRNVLVDTTQQVKVELDGQ